MVEEKALHKTIRSARLRDNIPNKDHLQSSGIRHIGYQASYLKIELVTEHDSVRRGAA